MLALPAVPAAAEEAAGAEATAVVEMSEITEITVSLSVVVKIELDAATALTEVAALEGAVVADSLIPSRGLYMVEGSATVAADKVLEETRKAAEKLGKELAKDERVVWAEPLWQATAEDNRFHAWPSSSPRDASEDDIPEQPAFAALGLAEASTLATGAGTVVAVLDTGIDEGHPLLSGRLLEGYDMVDDDADPADEANGADDDGDGAADEAFGHGTFVAGVVAQIAPDALIIPIRVLDADGTGALHAVIEGIDYAVESGADVINMSFGLVEKSDSKALKNALKRARKAGVVVVAAAGNDGDDEKRYPAAIKDIVSVTASNGDAASLAQFASRGKWVDVAAPGAGVVSAMPGGGYAEWDGSSMAAPVVSGQVALLMELRPEDDPSHLEKLLWKTSRKTEGSEGAEHGIVHILDSCREAG
jgi:subtilisin family serine protease